MYYYWNTKETKMKNCKTCGQPLPKKTPQPRDIVEIKGPLDQRLGIVLDPTTEDLYQKRFGRTSNGDVRVLLLNGSLKGLVMRYQPDRLTVVRGAFRVTERL